MLVPNNNPLILPLPDLEDTETLSPTASLTETLNLDPLLEELNQNQQTQPSEADRERN